MADQGIKLDIGSGELALLLHLHTIHGTARDKNFRDGEFSLALHFHFHSTHGRRGLRLTFECGKLQLLLLLELLELLGPLRFLLEVVLLQLLPLLLQLCVVTLQLVVLALVQIQDTESVTST